MFDWDLRQMSQSRSGSRWMFCVREQKKNWKIDEDLCSNSCRLNRCRVRLLLKLLACEKWRILQHNIRELCSTSRWSWKPLTAPTNPKLSPLLFIIPSSFRWKCSKQNTSALSRHKYFRQTNLTFLVLFSNLMRAEKWNKNIFFISRAGKSKE